MRLHMSLVLLLCGIIGATVCSSIRTSPKLNTEDAINILTAKLRVLEDAFVELRGDCATVGYVAKLTESLQNLEETTKAEYRSIRDDVYPRLKRLEDRENIPDDVTTLGYFDVTFHAEASLSVPLPYIEAYDKKNSEKIQFSRVPGTGTGEGLPANVILTNTSTSEKVDFSHVEELDRPAVYQCLLTDEDRNMSIYIPLYYYASLYFLDPHRVVNIGDYVKLELHSEKPDLRWRHNGVSLPELDNMKELEIKDVSLADAGIYEAYTWSYPDLAYLRLIVRKCPANLYGERCNQKCPPCYNGGICHDHQGICVCPSGFVGKNCETPCPEGSYGPECEVRCEDDCQYLVHCKPDPYGCSCARGYKGVDCKEPCEAGWYGADCKQPCHCAKGAGDCNRFTGSCSGGCSPGWSGDSCEIQDTD